MDVKEKKHVIKSYLGLSALVIIFILVAISIMKYEVEGEKNMPFLLSKIMVISTAEGVSKEEVQEEKRKYEEQRLEFEKEKLKLKLSI